jgi:MSHA pilin protein MshD
MNLAMRQALTAPTTARRARGVTLVELVVSLAVVATLVSGVWAGWALLTKRSADPLVLRQSLAVAESLLAEIQLQPAAAASGASGNDRTRYASVADYNGLALNGILDVQGQPIPGLEGYRAAVTVQARSLQGVPDTHGWWIDVRVTGPAGGDVIVSGWRSRR